MSQDVHAVKVALNYRLNDTGSLTPLTDLVAAVCPVRLSGWEPGSAAVMSMDRCASRRTSERCR